MVDALGEHIRQSEPPAPDSPTSLALFFEHVRAHQHVYRALVRGGGIDLLFKTGHERLRQNIEQHLRELLPAGEAPAAPLPLVADYMAGAILTMLKWWLDHDMPLAPAEMDALYHQLVLPGVQATLHIRVASSEAEAGLTILHAGNPAAVTSPAPASARAR